MSNDIRKLLDMHDENISFKENSVSYEQYKGVTCKFVKAVLTYEPSRCLKCDSKNVGASILKKMEHKHQQNYFTFQLQSS